MVAIINKFTFSKTKLITPCNRSGVSTVNARTWSTKVLNFWGVSLFNTLLTLLKRASVFASSSLRFNVFNLVGLHAFSVSLNFTSSLRDNETWITFGFVGFDDFPGWLLRLGGGWIKINMLY